MPLIFPSSPTIGQTYASGSSAIYEWNGSYWETAAPKLLVSASYSLTASHLIPGPSQSILLPNRDQSSWMWGMAYARQNEIFVIGSVWNSRPTGLYANNENGRWYTVPFENRPPEITKLVVDSNNMYALGSNGLAYSVGENNRGQLGRGPNLGGIQQVKTWSIMSPITSSGMSGSGIQVIDIYHPQETTNNLQDAYISSVIYKVLDNGTYKYYGAGYNSFGNLGIGNTTNQYTPSELTTLRGKNIVSMSMGSSDGTSVLACEDNGTPWVWGYNGWGQLGVGNVTTQNSPQSPKSGSALAPITGIIDVASTMASDDSSFRWYNTHLLKSDGTVLGSGTAAYYNRGDGQDATNALYFSDVRTAAGTKLQNIVKLYCRGFCHTALDSSGNLWGWGNDWWSWTGITNTTDYNRWAKIIATGVEDVYIPGHATRAASMFIKQGGEWYGSGFNDGWVIPVGYKRSTNIVPREKLALPQGEIKGFFPLGIYAGGNYNGTITLMTDDKMYANGRLNAVIYGGEYSVVPTRLELPTSIV